ncbi:MAG: Restriction endonuclease [Methanoregula sp. PtaU1.Bin051]|nr:MAG: Restriction endonuclease [Methanoregula sp. PtaU1.Bin051]
MAFCHECGNQLKGTEKFCGNCGCKLSDNINLEISQDQDLNLEREETHDENKAIPKIRDPTIGKNFENVVEQIYIHAGYITEKRQRIPGKSGYTNEIDVIAIKGRDKVAIECKNYLTQVGIQPIRDFAEKLQDLGHEWRGVVASYTDFSSDAEEFAKSRNIELLNNNDIKERLYSALSGRSAEKGDRIFIEDTLAVNIDYDKATFLDLCNSNHISVSTAKLVFHPYFRFNYKMNRIWFDRQAQKNRTFKDSGIVVIDLIDNEVITEEEDPVGFQEVIKNKPLKSISIAIDQNYRVIKIDPKYNKKALKNSAISYVIEENTRNDLGFIPKRQDITLDIGTLVYLPKWELNFDSHGKVYSREVLACSGQILFDTITNCPLHERSFFRSLNPLNKTIAVCEECGQAFCKNHGTQCAICKKWLCNTHSIRCSICQTPFCSDHIKQSCNLCNDYVCSNCVVTCTTCTRIVGKHHLKQCNHCGKTVCSMCVTQTGTLFKKYYCKDQCDLIVKAEKEKSSLMGKLTKKFK